MKEDSCFTFPQQADLLVTLLKTGHDAKFQNCLRQVIIPDAGKNLSSPAIARKFKLMLDELMIETPENMRNYFKERLISVIDLIINEKEIANQVKTIFEKIS